MMGRITLIASLFLPMTATAEPLDLSATWVSTEPGASATYDIFLNPTDDGQDFRIDVAGGRCLYLVAYNSQGLELWVQRPEILAVPTEVQFIFSRDSAFPFQLLAMHGTPEICDNITAMIDGGRNFSLGREVIAQLPDTAVSTRCVFRGIEPNQIRRMGQGDPGCP